MAINNAINANHLSPLKLPTGSGIANSLIKSDALGSLSCLGAATNGQIPIGSNDADPVLATLTAGLGISINNRPGEIIISSDNIVSLKTSNNTSATGSLLKILGDGLNISTSALNDDTITINQGPNLILPRTSPDLARGTIRIGSDVRMHFANTYNTFVGSSCGNGNVSGVNNFALANDSLGALTTGSENISIGSKALSACNEASGNIALGNSACSSVNTGNYNVAIGFSALPGVKTGSKNIAIGLNAGANLGGYESSNIYLANSGASGESATIRVGSEGDHKKCFIAGIINSPMAGTSVVASANGQIGILASSQRFKNNITDMGDRSSQVMKLRPVNFSYKEDASRSMQYGLIAEEVAETMPEIVTYDAAGNPHSVRYHEMPSILLNELQKMEKRLKDLEERCTCKG